MTNSTISLRNDHGLFQVDAEVLSRAIAQVGAASLTWVRAQAAGAAGYDELPFGATALDDCTLVEAIIIWVESGNHRF